MNEVELGLREAFDDELETIIERAEKYLPHSETVYRLLCVGFRRRFVDRKVTCIYVPVGNNLPFFIVIINVVTKPGKQNLTPFWDPKEISPENAKTLLKTLPNWNWEEIVFLNNASGIVLNEFSKIMLGEKGLCHNKLHLHRTDGYTYKLIDEENISIKSLGKDIFLSKINETFAPLVFKYWIYTNDTLEGIKSYMKTLPAVAAFVKVDPKEEESDGFDLKKVENGTLITYRPVAWAVTRFYGEIGFTYTLLKYRGKGLCTAVTLAVAKELRKLNISPYVNICEPNPSAIKSHLKAGFQKYCPCAYHIYLPERMEWKDF